MFFFHPPPDTPTFSTTYQSAARSPDTVECEIKTLSHQMRTEHDKDVLNLACLIYMTRKAFEHYEVLNDIDLSPMIALQSRYLGAWKKSRGIDPVAVNLAVDALKQAECSISHIDALDALDKVDVFLQLVPPTWTGRFAPRAPSAHNVNDARVRSSYRVKARPPDPWILANKEFMRSWTGSWSSLS